MKKIAISILLASTIALQAQEVGGKWFGELTQETEKESIPKKYRFFLNIDQEGSAISGTSKLVVKGTSNYALFDFEGSVEENVITITETKYVSGIIKDGFFWCDKVFSLALEDSKLIGDWTSEFCGPGTAILSKRGQQVDFSKVKSDKKLVLNDITFETGSANVTGDSYSLLEDLLDYLKSNNDVKLKVVGHTDDTGSDEVNIPLSLARAQAIVDYITNGGVSKSMLIAEGKGASEPTVSNDTAEGKAQNRRIEFDLID